MSIRKSALFLLLSLSLIILFGACVATGGPGGSSSALSPGKYAAIKSSCYEVVVKKPADDSLSYDKPLNWDLLDYRVREDEYIVLGTAFAISETDLVTASHVLHLDDKSLVYRERFIREKVRDGKEVVEKIYPLEKIKAYDNKRDYVVFTVRDKTFSDWIPMNSDYAFDSPIYTAGNAYGEGLVVRDGLLLDTIAEPDNGEWHFLKSSIATNPGNSGGPLLNADLEAIGVVLSKKDDFCYALPVEEIRLGTAVHKRDGTFGFAVFNQKHRSKDRYERELPSDYEEFVNWVHAANTEFYLDSMTALLEENEERTFPAGEKSARALYLARSNTFPQIFLEDSDDLNWFAANIETSKSDLGENGSIRWGEIYKDAGIWLMDIKRPDSVPARDIYGDPKMMMDLILKGIKIDRKLTDNDPGSRVLSYGDPIESSRHTDRWGREWEINIWLLEYLDRVVITLSLPTPRGTALVYASAASSDREMFLFDLRELTDFVNVSFGGDLAEWRDFLDADVMRGFEPIEALEIERDGSSGVVLETGEYRVEYPGTLFPIDEENELFLFFDIFLKNGSPVADIRKSIIDDGEDNDSYMLIYHWPEPYDRLPDNISEEWQRMVLDQGYPYDGKSSYEEGKTGIGRVHPRYIDGGVVAPRNGYVHTVFVSARGEADESRMESVIEALIEGIRFKE